MEEEEHREGEELRGFGTCRNCEKRIKTVPGKPRKIYCSEACRRTWWMEHPDMSMARTETFTCRHCGKEFEAQPGSGRKYCSLECYLDGRFPERGSRPKPAVVPRAVRPGPRLSKECFDAEQARLGILEDLKPPISSLCPSWDSMIPNKE